MHGGQGCVCGMLGRPACEIAAAGRLLHGFPDRVHVCIFVKGDEEGSQRDPLAMDTVTYLSHNTALCRDAQVLAGI